MGNKLSFDQMLLGLNALNTFENEYGKVFFALVTEQLKNSNSSTHTKTDVIISRGRGIDHNMPYVIVKDVPYYCKYTTIKNNGGCLTIYLPEKTIDITPIESE